MKKIYKIYANNILLGETENTGAYLLLPGVWDTLGLTAHLSIEANDPFRDDEEDIVTEIPDGVDKKQIPTRIIRGRKIPRDETGSTLF